MVCHDSGPITIDVDESPEWGKESRKPTRTSIRAYGIDHDGNKTFWEC